MLLFEVPTLESDAPFLVARVAQPGVLGTGSRQTMNDPGAAGVSCFDASIAA